MPGTTERKRTAYADIAPVQVGSDAFSMSVAVFKSPVAGKCEMWLEVTVQGGLGMDPSGCGGRKGPARVKRSLGASVHVVFAPARCCACLSWAVQRKSCMMLSVAGRHAERNPAQAC